MPLVFVNGGTPTLPGVVFQNIQELFTIVQNALTAAGWSAVVNTQGNLLFCHTHYNGNTAYVNVIHTDSGEFYISGHFLTGNNSWASTPAQLALFSIRVGGFIFNTGAPNRIWITADEHTGIIIVRPANTTAFYCTYFGWLDLNNPADIWAWVVENFGKESRIGGLGYIAKNYVGSSNWVSKQGPIIPQWGYGPLAINLFVSRISDTNPTNSHSSFSRFNAANNHKLVCGQVAYNYDGPGFFRGFFKFTLNGFTGLDCGTIHTRYIPESNQIAYYMAVSNGLNPQGNAEFGVLVGLS